MMKKICKIRYFIAIAVFLTAVMIGYAVIGFHYNSLTVSNTTPIQFENWKEKVSKMERC